MSKEITPEELEKKKKRNAMLWSDVSEEELIRDLWGSDFADYLERTRRGNGDARLPLKIFYSLKDYSKYILESSRLITIKDIEKKSGISTQNLRNHIMNFVRAGILTEHRFGQKLLAHKKAVTYLVKPYDEWNKDIEVDISNHVRLLMESKND